MMNFHRLTIKKLVIKYLENHRQTNRQTYIAFRLVEGNLIYTRDFFQRRKKPKKNVSDETYVWYHLNNRVDNARKTSPQFSSSNQFSILVKSQRIL